MMAIQPHSSPKKLTRVNKEPSKAKIAQEQKPKQPKIDGKEKSNGLRVPGSNWEKYKILLTDSKTNKKESAESTIVTSPRKRHRPKKQNLPNDSQVLLPSFFNFLLRACNNLP